MRVDRCGMCEVGVGGGLGEVRVLARGREKRVCVYHRVSPPYPAVPCIAQSQSLQSSASADSRVKGDSAASDLLREKKEESEKKEIPRLQICSKNK